MIILNNKNIQDPSLLTQTEIAGLREVLFVRYPKIHIPKHITSNKEKIEYKAGYINELFSVVFPELLKKDIYTSVTERFDIFVEKRQYSNLINEYSLKKYSLFIKK